MLCNLALVTVVSLGSSLANAPAQPEHRAAIQSAAQRLHPRIRAEVEDRSTWMRLAQDVINPDKQAGPRIQPQPIPGAGAPRGLAAPRAVSQSEGARGNDLPGPAGARTDSLVPPPGR